MKTLKFIIPFLLFFHVHFSFAQQTKAGLRYIEKYHDLAIEEMQRTGIPASVTLAQGMHESNNGLSQVATMANNHFGLKCSRNWKSGKFYRNGDSGNNCYRKYPNARACFRDRSKIITTNKRYAFLFEYEITDYKKWCYGLLKAGYASTKHYPQRLIRTIEIYDLYIYDYVRMDDFAPKGMKLANKGPEKKTAPPSTAYKPPKRIIHTVKPGQTLGSIALRYQVSVNNIKKKNKLSSDIIKPGQKLIIR